MVPVCVVLLGGRVDGGAGGPAQPQQPHPPHPANRRSPLTRPPEGCRPHLSCNECVQGGCGWCPGPDERGSHGHCGGNCSAADAPRSHAAGRWACASTAPPAVHSLAAAGLAECLMMAEMTVGRMPLSIASARIEASGWLRVRNKLAAGARVKHVWEKQWCTANGTALACKEAPLAAQTSTFADLATCTAVQKSSRGKKKKNEMELVCGGGSLYVAPPDEKNKKVWGKALITAITGVICQQASRHTAHARDTNSDADRHAAALAAAVAFGKLGALEAALDLWQDVASASQSPHLLLAAGWAHVEAGLASCLSAPCFAAAGRSEPDGSTHPAAEPVTPTPMLRATLAAGARLLEQGLGFFKQDPAADATRYELARLHLLLHGRHEALQTLERTTNDCTRCRALRAHLAAPPSEAVSASDGASGAHGAARSEYAGFTLERTSAGGGARVRALPGSLFFQALRHHIAARQPLKATAGTAGHTSGQQPGDAAAAAAAAADADEDHLDRALAHLAGAWDAHVAVVPTSLNDLSRVAGGAVVSVDMKPPSGAHQFGPLGHFSYKIKTTLSSMLQTMATETAVPADSSSSGGGGGGGSGEAGRAEIYLNVGETPAGAHPGASASVFHPPLDRFENFLKPLVDLAREVVELPVAHVNAWLGATKSSTTSQLHCDPYDSLYIVFNGTKTFVLADPSFAVAAGLQTTPPIQRVDGSGLHRAAPHGRPDAVFVDDRGAASTFARADAVAGAAAAARPQMTTTVTLGPGDVLFVPAGWYVVPYKGTPSARFSVAGGTDSSALSMLRVLDRSRAPSFVPLS